MNAQASPTSSLPPGLVSQAGETPAARRAAEPSRGPLFRPALLCLAAYAVLGTILSVAAAAMFLRTHRDTSYTEAPTIYAGIMALRTGHMYYPLDAPPYSPQPYGPLFYAYNVAIARIAHSDILETFFLSRVVTFSSFLLCPLLIYLISSRLRFPPQRAAIGALIFPALPYCFPHNASVRPDFACLMFMLLSLLCAMPRASAISEAGPLAYMPAGLWAGVAFLIKQPAVAVSLSISVVLLLKRRNAQAAAFLFGAALPVAAALGILELRHEPFWPQLLVELSAIWSLRSGAVAVWGMLRNPNAVIPLGILILALAAHPSDAFGEVARGPAHRSERDGERLQMVASFTAVNFIAALAMIPTVGGNINYFYPACAGAAILLPRAIEWTAQQGRVLQSAVCALTILWLMLGAVSGAEYLWQRQPFQQQTPVPLDQLQNLRILSDRPYFNLLGRDPQFLDPYLLHTLELTGSWNTRPLLESVRESRFDLVILAAGAPLVTAYRGVSMFSPALLAALNENYEPLCEVSPARYLVPQMVLQPRGRPAPLTSEALSRTLNRPCVSQLPGRNPGLFIEPHAR